MRKNIKNTLILLAATATATGAMAHTGADVGAHTHIAFMDGLLHPLTGLDHLAAMLAVGLWSALSARRVWTAPLAFAGMLLVGALMGLAGVNLPAVEPMIAASLLVLGLMVATQARMPGALAAGLVGAFAVFHGVAHGAELAGATSALAPLAGMLLSTIALHLTGVALGLALRTRSQWWPRATGAVITLLGGVFLLQMI